MPEYPRTISWGSHHISELILPRSAGSDMAKRADILYFSSVLMLMFVSCLSTLWKWSGTIQEIWLRRKVLQNHRRHRQPKHIDRSDAGVRKITTRKTPLLESVWNKTSQNVSTHSVTTCSKMHLPQNWVLLSHNPCTNSTYSPLLCVPFTVRSWYLNSKSRNAQRRDQTNYESNNSQRETNEVDFLMLRDS